MASYRSVLGLAPGAASGTPIDRPEDSPDERHPGSAAQPPAGGTASDSCCRWALHGDLPCLLRQLQGLTVQAQTHPPLEGQNYRILHLPEAGEALVGRIEQEAVSGAPRVSPS